MNITSKIAGNRRQQLKTLPIKLQKQTEKLARCQTAAEVTSIKLRTNLLLSRIRSYVSDLVEYEESSVGTRPKAGDASSRRGLNSLPPEFALICSREATMRRRDFIRAFEHLNGLAGKIAEAELAWMGAEEDSEEEQRIGQKIDTLKEKIEKHETTIAELRPQLFKDAEPVRLDQPMNHDDDDPLAGL